MSSSLDHSLAVARRLRAGSWGSTAQLVTARRSPRVSRWRDRSRHCPSRPEGDDISTQIEEHRAAIPMTEHVVTMDAEQHAKTRGLLSKLITPKRLSENEDFMWRLVDQQIDKFLNRGSCEFMADYAKPLTMLVIADLLGVPLEDHDEFRRVLGDEVVGDIGAENTVAHNPLVWLDEKFASYIVNRRCDPRGDVLTELAAATYPDGSVPDVDEVVKLATFLLAAGMETRQSFSAPQCG
jgi:cytochrome P450